MVLLLLCRMYNSFALAAPSHPAGQWNVLAARKRVKAKAKAYPKSDQRFEEPTRMRVSMRLDAAHGGTCGAMRHMRDNVHAVPSFSVRSALSGMLEHVVDSQGWLIGTWRVFPFPVPAVCGLP